MRGNPGFFPFTTGHQREEALMNQFDQTTTHALPAASALPTVTTGPLPASSKRHVPGVIHPDILVPMRQIAVHPTAGEPPVTVYDASGPYTDPAVQTDIARGLASVRGAWVTARSDCQAYAARSVQPADNGFATGTRLVPGFPAQRIPLRAQGGKAVTRAVGGRAADGGTAARFPSLPVCLQPGNHPPPGPQDDDAFIDMDGILQCMGWLVDRVMADRWFAAHVLPQLQVLLWGNKRGV